MQKGNTIFFCNFYVSVSSIISYFFINFIHFTLLLPDVLFLLLEHDFFGGIKLFFLETNMGQNYTQQIKSKRKGYTQNKRIMFTS